VVGDPDDQRIRGATDCAPLTIDGRGIPAPIIGDHDNALLALAVTAVRTIAKLVGQSTEPLLKRVHG
jgi:hypothetical protein